MFIKVGMFIHFIVLYKALQARDHARYTNESLFVMAKGPSKREKLACDNFQPD